MTDATTKSAEWEASERAFDCVFDSFTRLGAGNSSRNFRAVMPDGRKVLVKFANERRSELLLPRLRSISSRLVPPLAFGGATGRFRHYVISAMEWCGRGENIPPYEFTDGQLRGILAGYAELTDAFAAVDAASLQGSESLRDVAGRCGLVPRPIHGDFHYRNFFMDGDSLVACFDFECMRLGIPTEDLLRIFVHELERTRFWCLGRTNAIFRNFGRLVALSPYGMVEWLAAIDIYERNKAQHRAAKKKLPFIASVEAVFRSPLYRRLRRIVRKVKANG